MTKQGEKCPNFNHGRTNAPVRYCLMCGEVVNENIPPRECNKTEHARKRRQRSKYCVDCGEQLIRGI